MAYQMEWVAVPTPFITDGAGISGAVPFDGSTPLILRLRISCDTTTEWNNLKAANFTISAAKNLEDYASEIANLTKQPNPPYLPFGNPPSYQYKDFSIDVSEIARSMMSHDLPLATASPTVVVDETDMLSLTNTWYKGISHIQPCTMNNITLHVTPTILAQSEATGLLNVVDFVGTGQMTSVFTVVNSCSTLAGEGAIDFSRYRINAESGAMFLNKMRSANYNASKDPQIKKVITQRPKDECSLYGINTEDISGDNLWIVAITFQNHKNIALEDCQIYYDFNTLNSYTDEPNGYIQGAGKLFQIAVGLKTLMELNPNVKAHVLNNNIDEYFVQAYNVSAQSTTSEKRTFNVEQEHDGIATIDRSSWQQVTIPDSGIPNGSTEWLFGASSGTFGWAISGNRLRSISSGQSNQVVYSATVQLFANLLYKLEVTLSTVPSTNSSNIVTIGTWVSGAFVETNYTIEQDPDYVENNAGAASYVQTIYFSPQENGLFALRKVSGYVAHDIDNIKISYPQKWLPMPRVEAFPNLRVFWLNRLGGMDWFDFKDEYKEEISVKRTKVDTSLEGYYDPRMNAMNRNSATGGRHNLPNIGLSENQVPYRWENQKGTLSDTNNPYGTAGYTSQAGQNARFAKAHDRTKIAYSSEVTTKIKLTSGLLPTFLIKDLEDLITSNAVYIQRWHDNPNDTSQYGHNYLEPVLMQDGSWTVVDEAQKIVRLDITLEKARKIKTQHGG